MSTIKSLSVDNGDMFYIKHNTDNFTIIDCCMRDEEKESIVAEIKAESKSKGITRFISTHPDNDHIMGLDYLNNEMRLLNFYCVENRATKPDDTVDFRSYCKLRDSKDAFYLYQDCSRKWLNQNSEERGSSGINILWPVLDNEDFKNALGQAKNGESYNNISPIIKYREDNGPTVVWMGDLENDFMDLILSKIKLPKTDILFAPHHGRDSGKVPTAWLNQMQPALIVIGQAPSIYLNYYSDYQTITQNTARSITFDCLPDSIDIYVSNRDYSVNFLVKKHNKTKFPASSYIGSLELR